MPAWISGESTDRSSPGRQLTVVDLSMHGVGLRDPQQKYRVNATHWLVINGQSMRMSCRIKVVSCREHEEGGYQIGAAFF